MAGKNEVVPIIGCKEKDCQGVYDLADNVVVKGVYAHPETYAHPTISIEDFGGDNTLLGTLIRSAPGNTNNIKLRDDQCTIVYGNLVVIKDYALPICRGNLQLVLDTGYGTSHDPAKHPPPEQPVILRIEEGKIKGTYRIFIKQHRTKDGVKPDPKTSQRGVKYSIEISYTPDIEDSWVLKLGSLPSNALIFSKLTPLTRVYVRVYGTNNGIPGQASVPYPFVPQ